MRPEVQTRALVRGVPGFAARCCPTLGIDLALLPPARRRQSARVGQTMQRKAAAQRALASLRSCAVRPGLTAIRPRNGWCWMPTPRAFCWPSVAPSPARHAAGPQLPSTTGCFCARSAVVPVPVPNLRPGVVWFASCRSSRAVRSAGAVQSINFRRTPSDS